MTAREIFEAMLIECSKVNAPSLLLEEYNYYINKAINNFINKKYNIYDVNLLTTDDIRVLKSTAVLTPTKVGSNTTDAVSDLSHNHPVISKLQGATYEVNLPADYLHLLNCICVYKVNKNYKCYNGGSYVQAAAKRLTADSWSSIINDYYNKPTPQRPYYYLHNVNVSKNLPTNPTVWNEGEYVSGTDMVGLYDVESTGNGTFSNSTESSYSLSENAGSNLPRVITVGDEKLSTVEKATAHRYGNASSVRLEIRYGKDNSVFELVEVDIDYIKTPQYVRLTQELMDLTEDTSQIMEYPDYVCQEIINELTILVMARTGDPLLQNFIPVNNTIANPAQLQQPASAASQS